MNEFVFAGFSRRLAAFCLDLAFFTFFICAISFILVFPTVLIGFFSAVSMLTITLFTIALWLGGMTFFFGLHWLYYAGFEASYLQATPGKVVLGLYVCDDNDERITLKQSTIRYFSRFLSMFLLYFGYLISFFTAKRQTLHDLLSRTLVVRGVPAAKRRVAALQANIEVQSGTLAALPAIT